MSRQPVTIYVTRREHESLYSCLRDRIRICPGTKLHHGRPKFISESSNLARRTSIMTLKHGYAHAPAPAKCQIHEDSSKRLLCPVNVAPLCKFNAVRTCSSLDLRSLCPSPPPIVCIICAGLGVVVSRATHAPCWRRGAIRATRNRRRRWYSERWRLVSRLLPCSSEPLAFRPHLLCLLALQSFSTAPSFSTASCSTQRAGAVTPTASMSLLGSLAGRSLSCSFFLGQSSKRDMTPITMHLDFDTDRWRSWATFAKTSRMAAISPVGSFCSSHASCRHSSIVPSRTAASMTSTIGGRR